MKRTHSLFIMSLLFILFLVGCQSAKETEPKKEPEDKGIKKEEQSPNYYPYTGIEIQNDDTSERPIAVVINNEVAARPQSGLTEADIVIEMLTEANITRFLAIYQSELPEKYGPVRSAREYFVHLADGYEALFIAHGYSPEAKQMLQSGKYDNINGMQYDGTLFKRASFRQAPHNSYITSKAVYEGAEQLGYETDKVPEQLPMIEETEATGEMTNHIAIAYGSTDAYEAEYKYNEEGYYTRYQASEQTVDYETNQEVQLQNIFIIEADHQVIDDKGRRAIDFTSGGKAYLLQKGKLREVEWENKDGKILPIDDGMIPGKTWINFVPDLNNVSIIE